MRGKRGIDDKVNESWPRRTRQVVAHAGDRLPPRTRDRLRGRVAPGGMDHPVSVAVDHQRRHLDLPQLPGAVARREDAGQLPCYAVGRLIPVPVHSRALPDPLLVERKPVRSDVPENAHRPLDCLIAVARRARRGQPPPGRQRGPPDARCAGGGHQRRQRPHPSRIVGGDSLSDHAAHRDAHQVSVAVAERVEDAHGVPRHVAKVVLAGIIASPHDRPRLRRRKAHVGGPAHVAVVDARHEKAAARQRLRELLWPRVKLLTQPGDQHHGWIARVADRVTAQPNSATDVDNALCHADNISVSCTVGIGQPGARRYTTARPPLPGAVATPRE